MIKILKRRQIDTNRWDQVIASSLYENIYAYSWYLDQCADYWVGFVMNDYECIMPVAFRKKIGLKYVYQPFYCQQLGVYSALPVDSEIVRIFLYKLGSIFRMGDYSFNAGNVLGTEIGFEENDNANYILDLNNPYELLHKNYTENCRRNVAKAYHYDMKIDLKVSVEEMLSLKKYSEKKQHGSKMEEYRKKIFSVLDVLEKTDIIGARVGNHLVAAAVFAKSLKRATFLLSASSDRGKELRGMFMIVDTFIRQNANSSLKLDFEGSNILTVARFFRGFGAKPEIYQKVSMQNRPYKILRKLRGG